MSEAMLRPYTEFKADELASQLGEVVVQNKGLLAARNLVGVIDRYGHDFELAKSKVEKGQREHAQGELGHYAIIGISGDVIGSASVYPGLTLRKLRLPIPAGIGRRYSALAVDYPYARPNIHAWAAEDEDVLADAYQALATIGLSDLSNRNRLTLSQVARREGIALPSYLHQGAAWTVEPHRSPSDIHESITAKSGLKKVATKRFDDGENGLKIPPRGILYADLSYEWYGAYGKQKELRTGQKSFLTKLDEDEDEMLSRNPLGY